ncbi:MAG: DUF4962 domain-containing protein [Candidatus Latescibacteria bacterium]|jgi:hypothetical protein|nr:DUF4962 domain-containing protein [Candidatus Latescibacterota bacterium]
MKKLTAILSILFLLSTQIHTAEYTPPEPNQILKNLKKDHPRLIIDAQTIPRMKTIIAQDTVAAKIYRRIKRQANQYLKDKPSIYELPDGRRLLRVSRRVKERVRTLALIYLLDGGQQYVDRAWVEIEAAAAFKDWNPAHFLDTAEMTYAFATAYDWLYDQWTEEQRQIMREAIIEKGLKPGLEVYRKDVWWARNHNNWNQVCNGGLGMGALAIAEHIPELATEILHSGLKSIPRAMTFFAPDGAGVEGVTYWSYGSRYNILYLSSLTTALGTDFGLSNLSGFKESGAYHIYISGAKRMSYNFADCGYTRVSTPMHFWMGHQYNQPHYAWFRYDTLRKYGRGHMLDLLWFDNSATTFDPSTAPLDKHFRKADVTSMRSSWTDSNALALGIQAGGNLNLGQHRHLDQGTFILEALGERWAIDSGTERETYQRHRNKRKRWEFYRIRAEGHNTLVFNPQNGPDQNPKAKCSVTTFESTPNKGLAVLDLTDVYTDHVRQAKRTFEMVDRQHVVITDEIQTKSPSELYWFMHTNAEIAPNGATAILTQNGKQLTAEILSPSGATFTSMDAKPLPTSPVPKQADNKKRRKLTIHLRDVTNLTIQVKLTPLGNE